MNYKENRKNWNTNVQQPDEWDTPQDSQVILSSNGVSNKSN